MAEWVIERIGFESSRRTVTLCQIVFCIICVLIILLAGLMMNPDLYAADYHSKNVAPALTHLFGTDYMGRDTFFRTIKGLSGSILIGMFASVLSSVISLVVGVVAACGSRRVDGFCVWLINCFMGIPGLVLLILTAYANGRGIQGVVIGVAVTHWPDLARVIREEVLSVKHMQYVLAAKKMGHSNWEIAVGHIMPYIIPQFLVGLILMFPHAILHEAGITFLGFGLPLESPAVGTILAEAMRQLSTGQWWCVLFPGLSLLLIVFMIDSIGENIRLLLDPHNRQE